MKKRIGIRVPANIEKELNYFTQKYNVSDAYVLLLGYKLSDRRRIEEMLQLAQKEVDQGD